MFYIVCYTMLFYTPYTSIFMQRLSSKNMDISYVLVSRKNMKNMFRIKEFYKIFKVSENIVRSETILTKINADYRGNILTEKNKKLCGDSQ